VLWDTLNTNDFYFILFYFSDFIWILFFFSFGWWRGIWHGSHMTCHIMWHHRPRTWWKDLEDDVSVKIVDDGLNFYFYFLFYFYFSLLFFYFSIFRTTQVRVYQSRCHISHKLMAKSQDWSRNLGEWSRRFWNKVTSYSMDNTCWPHVILMVV